MTGHYTKTDLEYQRGFLTRRLHEVMCELDHHSGLMTRYENRGPGWENFMEKEKILIEIYANEMNTIRNRITEIDRKIGGEKNGHNEPDRKSKRDNKHGSGIADKENNIPELGRIQDNDRQPKQG